MIFFCDFFSCDFFSVTFFLWLFFLWLFLPITVAVPPYFYTGSRRTQAIHCKLRLGISNLNQHLHHRHLTDNPSCSCGADAEDSTHCLLQCPLYNDIRTRTLFSTNLNYSINDLLNGNPTFSVYENKCLFEIVHSFITESGRFDLLYSRRRQLLTFTSLYPIYCKREQHYSSLLSLSQMYMHVSLLTTILSFFLIMKSSL